MGANKEKVREIGGRYWKAPCNKTIRKVHAGRKLCKSSWKKNRQRDLKNRRAFVKRMLIGVRFRETKEGLTEKKEGLQGGSLTQSEDPWKKHEGRGFRKWWEGIDRSLTGSKLIWGNESLDGKLQKH